MKSRSDLTRDEVRKVLEHCQMNYPTPDQVTLLHGHIARELIEFDGIRGSYRVGHLNPLGKDIRVVAYYFKEGRQGVTFEPDGFVGIAGWADDTNVQPLLRALLKWAEEVSGYVAQ